MNIPKTPFVVLFGLIAVAGLMAYLIWQVGKPLGESASQKVETEPRPDLPGEFVDLPAIYGDSTSPHVTRTVDFGADGNSPLPAAQCGATVVARRIPRTPPRSAEVRP